MFRIKTDIRQYKCETPEKVEKLIRNWVIRPTDLIYHHKNKSWRPIGEHPNFQGIFAQLAEQDTAQGATVVTPQGESVGGGSAGEAGATDAQLAEAMQKVRIKLPPVSSKRLHQTTGRIHLPEDFLSNAVMERPLRRGEKPAEADLVERVAATWQGIEGEPADDLRETNELTPEELQAFARLRAEQRAAEQAASAGSEKVTAAASDTVPTEDSQASLDRVPSKPSEKGPSAPASTPAEEPLPKTAKAPETEEGEKARAVEPVETPPARQAVPMPPPPAKAPPKQDENFISGGYALDLPFAIGPSEEDRSYGLVVTRTGEEELDRIFPRPVPKRRHEVTQRAFTLNAAPRRPAASGRVASVPAPGPAPAPADRSLLVVTTILAVLVIIIAVAVAAGGA